MDGIAERVENRLHITGNVGIVDPDVGHRQSQVFGEGPGAIDADSLGVLAQVPAAGQAIAAAPTDDVPFAADDFAGMKVLHIRADIDNFADELMAHDQGDGDRFLRPGVPFIDVQIRAANARPQDLDEHVVDAERRHGHIVEPKADRGMFFDEGFHGRHQESPCNKFGRAANVNTRCLGFSDKKNTGR